jgi:hypothetical protein
MSGDNKELKSAFDIAMERAQRLGGLSAEEKKRLKEGELAEVGDALGKRYLSGLPIRDVELELEKYKEDRPVLIRYFLTFLVDKISFTKPDDVEKILEAIRYFSKRPKVIEGIRDIINEYRRVVEQARQEIQSELGAAKRKELAKKGISGSAVEPALEASPEWLETSQHLLSEYQKRLEGIKSSLQAL